MQLNNKTVAITGGSGGLGTLVCQALEKAGARIIVLDRVPCGENYTYVPADLSTSEGIDNAAQQLVARSPDVLINLAGIQYFGQLEKQSQENIILTYMINLIAPVLLSRAVLPLFRAKNSGAIVNVGSTFGSIPFAHFATYSSSKAGLRGLSEALRREVNGTNIQVTYIAPRAIKTPLNSANVLKWAEATGMAMDAPQIVAAEVVQAIINNAKDVYVGFPESLFVKINAVLPRLVDIALAKNDSLARTILTTSEKSL
jgi:short-subunit dehydrogenase